MRSFLQEHSKITHHVINMTDKPIHLYDDFSGDIVTFYPNARRFCQKRSKRLFPEDAYYVFTADMIDKIKWFQDYCVNIAIAHKIGHGHDGVELVSLMSLDQIGIIRFRKKTY